MYYRILPGTNLRVSTVCLGCGPLGTALDEAASFALLDRFVLEGGTFLDTANIYGKWEPSKQAYSEITIGNWLSARKLRSQVIVGTKGAHPELETMDIPRLSAGEIVADLEESLANLQTDYVDLYWLHRDDPNRPVGEILETLQEQVKEGKLCHFGCSNWTASRIREAMDYAAKHGISGFVANQMMWNLAVPNPVALGFAGMVAMDEEGLRMHRETGLAAIPYNSQASGFFTKALQADFETNQAYDGIKRSYFNEQTMLRVKRVKDLATQWQADGTQIALAYLLSQPFLTVPIIGPKDETQLLASLSALRVELEPKELEYLNGTATEF